MHINDCFSFGRSGTKRTGNAFLPLILFLSLALFSSAVSAHSVAMNFRFHIVDIGDTVHINGTSYNNQQLLLSFPTLDKPYISAERADRNNTLVAFTSAGGVIGAVLNTQSDPYLFQIAQDEPDNMFVLALTRGGWRDAERQRGVPAATVGNLTAPESITPGLALQLQFDSIDLTGVIGPGQILIKSLGGMVRPLVELLAS